MMAGTHRAYSDVFWLGTTGAVNSVILLSGHSHYVSIIAVGSGAFLAKPFSSGNHLSPDMDHRWAPGPPRNHYDWRFHRGWTHRLWFASVLLLLFGILPMVALLRIGVPIGIAVTALAPVAGWWSHLSGDMIYGRILILGTPVGLGWRTGGLSETGRPVGGGKRWLPTNPAERVFYGCTWALILLHLVLAVAFVQQSA